MEDAEEQGRPRPPSWLDKDFIQKVLRSKDALSSYHLSPTNAEGDGYLSNMFRVTARTQDSKERRLIVKCQPMGGHREVLISSLDAYNKETRMLATTLPAMHQLLEQASPGQFQPFCARCLHHGDHPVPFIVMEDLCEAGFVLANRQRGLDLHHSSMVISTLARLHASSLALHERNPQEVEGFKCPVNEDSREHVAAYYQNALRSLAKEVSQWPGYEKYVPKLENMVDSIFDRIMQCFKRKEDGFNVLCHGDTWTNNVMFKYSGKTLQDVRLVDFQLAYFTSPATDLHYFLYSSPSEEVRIKHMDDLIEEYHRTFTKCLKILGCDKHIISLQMLQNIFKDHLFYGLISAIAVMPIVVSEPENSLDVEEALGEGSDSQGNNDRMYRNEDYVKTMKRLLPLFDEEGVFVQ